MTDTFTSVVVAMARLFADDRGLLSLDVLMDLFGELDSNEFMDVLDILDEEGVYVQETSDEESLLPPFGERTNADAVVRIARVDRKNEYTHRIVCTHFFSVQNKVA